MEAQLKKKNTERKSKPMSDQLFLREGSEFLTNKRLNRKAIPKRIKSALYFQTCFKNMPLHGRTFETGPMSDPPSTDIIGIRGFNFSK